jgi:cell division protein FtsB
MANEKSRKQGKQSTHSVTALQFLVIILITIALAVVLDFGHRLAVNADLKREARQLERQVATLEAEHRALETQQVWVQTEGYVEEWARTEGSMVLEGEIPVVPVPMGQPPPAKSRTPSPSPEPIETPSDAAGETPGHWQEWWALFFGPEDELASEEAGG